MSCRSSERNEKGGKGMHYLKRKRDSESSERKRVDACDEKEQRRVTENET